MIAIGSGGSVRRLVRAAVGLEWRSRWWWRRRVQRSAVSAQQRLVQKQRNLVVREILMVVAEETDESVGTRSIAPISIAGPSPSVP